MVVQAAAGLRPAICTHELVEPFHYVITRNDASSRRKPVLIGAQACVKVRVARDAELACSVPAARPQSRRRHQRGFHEIAFERECAGRGRD